MADRFDVIVVGARCAGSPLAILLARAGMRVCVVDRARFPSDTASTHGVQPSGVKILGRLGVLEALLQVTPAIDRGTIAFDEARVELSDFTELVGAPMLSARRVTLDAVLVEAAAAAGAEVRTQTAVTGLIEQRGRVAGVKTKSGELRAPLVVGADGVHSAVARLVGAAKYDQTPAGRVFAWAYFEGAHTDDDHMWLGAIGAMASSPSPPTPVCSWLPSSPRYTAETRCSPTVRPRSPRSWPTGPSSRPPWPGRSESGRSGRCRGTASFESRPDRAGRWSETPATSRIPRRARASPTPSETAVELAAAIERALGGAGGIDQALNDWWRWRDRDAWEMYWFAHDMGAPGAPPLLFQAIQRRIAADPQLTEGLLRVLNHDVAPSKLFTPSLALAATSKALLTSPGQRKTLLREAGTLAANN